MMGPAPFYDMQALHDAQSEPVAYDGQPGASPFPAGSAAPPSDASPYMGGSGQPSLASGMDDGSMAPPDWTQDIQPQQAQATPPSPTLEDHAAALADASQSPDLSDRLNHYVDMAMRANAPNMMATYDNPGGGADAPGLLTNILTMGMAGLAKRNNDLAWNEMARRNNTAVREKALGLAHSLMQADAQHEMANANLMLRGQQFQLGLLRAQYEGLTKQLQNELNAGRLHREHVQDVENGIVSPDDDTTGGSEPPAPGSPLANAMGGSTPGATNPSDLPQPPTPVPGHPAFNKVQMQTYAATSKAKMAADQETATNADAVRRVLGSADIEKAIKILPASSQYGALTRLKVGASASSLNPLNSGFQNKLANGDPDAKALSNLALVTIPFIRAMSLGTKGNRLTTAEIGLLTKDNLQRMAHGQMSQEEALQTRDAILSALDKAEGKEPAQPSSSTTSTPTGGTTSSTGAPRILSVRKIS